MSKRDLKQGVGDGYGEHLTDISYIYIYREQNLPDRAVN